MRAFLSTSGSGPYYLDGGEVSAGGRIRGGGARDDAFAAKWAEREARAILAETEPGQFDACSGAHHFGLRETARTGSLVGHGCTALAEALAAFVEG